MFSFSPADQRFYKQVTNVSFELVNPKNISSILSLLLPYPPRSGTSTRQNFCRVFPTGNKINRPNISTDIQFLNQFISNVPTSLTVIFN